MTINNNELIYAIKTTYDFLSAREKAIYNTGYKAGMKANQKPFKFVPTIVTDSKTILFKTIVEKVCEFYKIGKKELFNKSRLSYLVLPRSMAINLSYELTGHSYPKLGSLTNRDHTSLLYHVNLRVNCKGMWENINNHTVFSKLSNELFLNWI